MNMVEDPAETYGQPDSYTDEYVLDSHGHLIVKHDLFNHDGLTQDGIAEAFLEFAKKEKLSFVSPPPEGCLKGGVVVGKT